VAIGGDLSEARLLAAYSRGIFPWYCEGEPILWWSPDPRLILEPSQFHMPRRLRNLIRQDRFTVTMDRCFDGVIEACANVPRPGQDGIWLTKDMIAAYRHLHRLGFAHPVECRHGSSLAGGLYGISLGRCFFGESMFHHMPDASKVALAALVRQMLVWKFDFIDCQVTTQHLLRSGARHLSRQCFLNRLQASITEATHRGPWRFTGWPEHLATSGITL